MHIYIIYKYSSICTYIYIYICVCLCIYTFIYIYIYVYIYIYIHIFIYVYTYRCICMHTYLYTHICAYMHICIRTKTHLEQKPFRHLVRDFWQQQGLSGPGSAQSNVLVTTSTMLAHFDCYQFLFPCESFICAACRSYVRHVIHMCGMSFICAACPYDPFLSLTCNNVCCTAHILYGDAPLQAQAHSHACHTIHSYMSHT